MSRISVLSAQGLSRLRCSGQKALSPAARLATRPSAGQGEGSRGHSNRDLFLGFKLTRLETSKPKPSQSGCKSLNKAQHQDKSTFPFQITKMLLRLLSLSHLLGPSGLCPISALTPVPVPAPVSPGRILAAGRVPDQAVPTPSAGLHCLGLLSLLL